MPPSPQHDAPAQRVVRTIPPWVRSRSEDEEPANPTEPLLPQSPSKVQPASHNHTPTPKGNAPMWRQYDRLRESTPPTVRTTATENAPRWRQFIREGPHPLPARGERIVDEQWMKDNLPDLEAQFNPPPNQWEKDQKTAEADISFARRILKDARRIFTWNLWVPFSFRFIVLIFSVLSLGLSGSIFHKVDQADKLDKDTNCQRGSSTWMALIIDTVAIPYTGYIMYDEFNAPPLGLRSHRTKLLLLFLDLFYVVFDSANLALAFEALTDENWACRPSPRTSPDVCKENSEICGRQEALTATLFVVLVAWLSTFTVSILRVVEKQEERTK